MAIQNRRGVYTDFDKTKMVEGEFAIVLDGDPEATNGQAAYISFQNGTAKRLATAEDVASDVDAATQDIQATLTENISDFIEGAQEDVDGMLGTVNTAVADANTRVAALEQDVADEIQSAQSSVAGIQADYQGLKTDNADQLYAMNQSVNTAIANISDAAQTATEAAVYATSQADEVRRIIEEGGTVATVFGRSGAVEALNGDYDSTMITHGQSNVSEALAAKQNTLVAGNGIKITGQLIEVDEQFEAKDPSNVYYGGLLSAQGQGVLGSASGTSFAAITTGSTFNQTYPLLYASENIAAMTTDTGDELGIYMLYATADNPVASASQAQHSPVYLVGTVSGNTFTVDSTTAYTHTKPATSDGKEYLLLGWTGQDARYFVFDPTPNQDLSGMIVAQDPSAIIDAPIKELINKTTGDIIHPLTTIDAVYGDANVTLRELLDSVDMARKTAPNGTDLNTLGQRSGIWGLSGLYTYSNMPDGLTYGTLMTIKNSPNSGFVGQIIVNGDAFWFRHYENSSWKPWRRIYMYSRETESFTHKGLTITAERESGVVRVKVTGTTNAAFSQSAETLCTLSSEYRPVLTVSQRMLFTSTMQGLLTVSTGGAVQFQSTAKVSDGSGQALASGSMPRCEITYLTTY